MADTVRRLVWLAVVMTTAFFAIFSVLGNFVEINAQNGGPIAIHDSLSPGVHRLNGILTLPLACDELSVGVEQVSENAYVLAFTTWQDPSIVCPREPTPRAFDTIAFAPSVGTDFYATFNGQPMQITIVPDVAASSTDL